MPRGKIATERLAVSLTTEEPAQSPQNDDKKNDDKSETKFTLVETQSDKDAPPAHPETESAADASAETVTAPSSSSGTLFTLLLIALFITISMGLIVLLGDNQSTPVAHANNTAQDKPAEKTQAAADAPAQAEQKSIPAIPAPAPAQPQAQIAQEAVASTPAVSSESAERELLTILNKN